MEKQLLKLVGLAGELAGREFHLTKPVTSVGKRVGSGVPLSHPSVRLDHANIFRSPAKYAVRPVNGEVHLNGRKIEQAAQIKHGDRLRFGEEAEFLVQKHEPLEERAASFFRETVGEAHALFPDALKQRLYEAPFTDEHGHAVVGNLRNVELRSAAAAAQRIIARLKEAGMELQGVKIVDGIMNAAQAAPDSWEAVDALHHVFPAAHQVEQILEASPDLKTAKQQVERLSAFLKQDIRKTTSLKVADGLKTLPLKASVAFTPDGKKFLTLVIPPITNADLEKAGAGAKLTHEDYARRLAVEATTQLFSSVLDARHFKWELDHPFTMTTSLDAAGRNWRVAITPDSLEAEQLLQKLGLELAKRK
ncbi:MAG: FHA domain-containing protein [Candidatus Micrarchaeota archaeon]